MDSSPTVLWSATAAVAAAILAIAMGLFRRKNRMPVEGKTVLITGASEGMGRSAARMLAERGANIILVSRSVGKLEEVLAELKTVAKTPSQRFHYISADVAAPDYAAPLLAEAVAWNHGQLPDIVWCIAGMATPGIYTETPFELTRRNMDVNFYGQAEMAHAYLREALDPSNAAAAPSKKNASSASSPASDRHFIFTTSVVAFFTIAGYGPYAPSKWAVRGLADTLSQEVLLYPGEPRMRIHVVTPGTILSPGLQRENATKPAITHILEKDDPQQTPDDVAAAAIRGLERGDYFVTVSWLGHLMRWSSLSGSLRNSWAVDLAMALVTPFVWLFVLPDILGKIKKYGRDHGHPSTYSRKAS